MRVGGWQLFSQASPLATRWLYFLEYGDKKIVLRKEVESYIHACLIQIGYIPKDGLHMPHNDKAT